MLVSLALLVALLFLSYRYYRLYQKWLPFREMTEPGTLTAVAYGPDATLRHVRMKNMCFDSLYIDVDTTRPASDAEVVRLQHEAGTLFK